MKLQIVLMFGLLNFCVEEILGDLNETVKEVNDLNKKGNNVSDHLYLNEKGKEVDVKTNLSAVSLSEKRDSPREKKNKGKALELSPKYGYGICYWWCFCCSCYSYYYDSYSYYYDTYYDESDYSYEINEIPPNSITQVNYNEIVTQFNEFQQHIDLSINNNQNIIQQQQTDFLLKIKELIQDIHKEFESLTVSDACKCVYVEPSLMVKTETIINQLITTDTTILTEISKGTNCQTTNFISCRNLDKPLDDMSNKTANQILKGVEYELTGLSKKLKRGYKTRK